MSTLSVHDIQGISTYGNQIRIPSGSNLNVVGDTTVGGKLDLSGQYDGPTWTTATRPSNPVVGTMGYNTETYLEVWDGTAWVSVTQKAYPDGVTNGLVLWLDANRNNGVSGNTWIDHSGTIGDVNINNRNNDWQFVTEGSSGLTCVYNGNNRTSSAGMNIPMNNGWVKKTATIDMWIRPAVDYTGGHGWFNNSDGRSYTNNTNWVWWGSWNTSNNHYLRFGNSSTCCNDLSAGGFRSNGYYVLNTWFHFVAAWDMFNTRARIYKNGQQIYSRTNFPSNITTSNPTNTGQLFNGHSRNDNMQFKGWCSQYRIYNRELSGAEVQSNYNEYKAFHGL